MSSRRTLILVGALAIGAVAALLIFRYVGGIEEKAQGDNQLVNVVVAKGAVKKGNESNGLIQTGVISMGERRRADVPLNAVTRLEDIKGQVAAIDLEPGTLITSTMFASPKDLSSSNSNVLEEGMVAVTTSTDQVKGVAGLVQPGDYVNLMVSGNCTLGSDGSPTYSAGQAAASGEGGGATAACTGHLFQKVRVLAIGRSLGTAVAAAAPADPAAAPATTAPPTSDLVTLEVPADAAQVIAAAGSGNLYMSLVRSDYQPKPIDITAFPLPLPGASGFTPYGGDPEASGEGN